MAETATSSICPEGTGHLVRRLTERGWEFDFFQAIWLLERHYRQRMPLGERGPVGKELIRFRPDVSVGFPATDIRRISPSFGRTPDETWFRVEVTFLGLYGVATPLPLHYAIDILRQVETGTTAAPGDTQATVPTSPESAEAGSTPGRDFLDLLHHRLVSLFYRSWAKYRHPVSFGMGDRDPITSYLLWLIGLGPGADESVLGVSPVRMIRYAGLLTQHPRSAANLEGLLMDYWSIPVSIQQFVGRWVPLGDEDRNSIGMMNSRLGEDLTVGEQVYDISGAFEIKLGPVDWTTYQQFLPDGPGYTQTRSLVRLYCADPLSFRIEIRLAAQEVPEMQLSSGSYAPRLGYNSWVRTDDLPETAVAFEATWSSADGM